MFNPKKRLSRSKSEPLAQGIHVAANGSLQVDGDKATLVLASGGRHSIQMQSAPSGGLCVRVESQASTHAVEPLIEERVFALTQSGEAREMFAERVRQWRVTLGGQAAPGRMAWLSALGGFGAGAIFVVGASVMFASTQPQLSGAPASPSAGMASPPSPSSPSPAMAMTPAEALLPAPPAPDLSGLANAQANPQRVAPGLSKDPQEAARQVAQARLSADERQAVAKATTLKLRDGKAVLSAFSDPLCPACQDLERQAEKMGPQSGFSVIPVAYQRGSRNLVASILCSANPSKAWTDTLRGERPATPSCEKGLRQVDANNEIFSKIGASATPTLVAPGGQLAQGSADTPELEQFLAAFPN